MGVNTRGRGLTLAALLLALSAIWLGSCGGHGAADGAGTPTDGGTVGAGATPAAAGFALPAPEAVLRAVPRSGSGAVLIRDGSDTLPGFTQLTVTESSSLRFQPDWQPGGDFEQLSYAIYNFNLLGYAAKPELRLVWDEAPQDGKTLWVGLARWDKARWDWFRGSAEGALDIGAHTYAEYTEPATGAVLVAVVMLGDAQPLLYQVRLGTVAAPWPMAGHDPQHTCRSPYTGPATNTLKWKFHTDVNDYAFMDIARAEDGTVYGCADGGIFAVDAYGNFKWFFDFQGIEGASGLELADTGTIFTTTNAYLYAINPTGSLKWKYPLWYSYFGTPDYVTKPEIAPNGNIYTITFSDTAANVIVNNPNGKLLWSYKLEYDWTPFSPVFGEDSTAYINTQRGRLYAFYPDGTLEWQVDVGASIYSRPAVGINGTIYCATDDGVLMAFDTDGIPEWTYTTDGAIRGDLCTGEDGAIYLRNSSHVLVCVDPTGSLRWQSLLAHDGLRMIEFNYPFISQTGEIFTRSGSTLMEFSSDGELLWSYPQFRCASAPCFSPDGSMFYGTVYNGVIRALNPERQKIWEFNSGGKIRNSPLVGNNGMVYLAAGEGDLTWKPSCLYAIYPDGRQAWKVSEFAKPGTPALDLDGSIIVYDSGLNFVESFDSNGESRWIYQINTIRSNYYLHDIIINQNGGIEFFADGVYSLSSNGKLNWTWMHQGSYINRNSNIVVDFDGNTVFEYGFIDAEGKGYDKENFSGFLAVADNGDVYGGNSLYIYSQSGWSAKHFLSSRHIVAAPAISRNGNIYSGSVYTEYTNKWSFVAVDPHMSMLWEFPLDAGVWASPAIDAAGTVYFGCDDHYLYALNADGTLKWKYETYAPVRSSPAIGADGTVYFGSDDGFLYAIGPGEG